MFCYLCPHGIPYAYLEIGLPLLQINITILFYSIKLSTSRSKNSVSDNNTFAKDFESLQGFRKLYDGIS